MLAGWGTEGEGEGGAADEKAAEEEAKARKARKPLQPYEVPTSGEFWMHDDRMGDDKEPTER